MTCPRISYGSSSQADFYADAIKLRADGTSFWLCCGGKSYPVNLHLTGMFNVSNALAAVASCHAVGLSMREIRTALEPMAARRMAERCNTEDIRRLENIHRSFLSAIQEGDAAMIGRLDEQFHSAIVESSGNALMIEINSHVCQGMQTFRSKTFQVEQNVKNAVMPHSNIMNAILARDAAQAEREMRAHLDKVQEDLTQNIHAPGHETK